MENDWFGPWCGYHAVVVQGGRVIVDEKHEYRRHVFENGQFNTEKIRIEKWWEMGHSYDHLPEGSLSSPYKSPVKGL